MKNTACARALSSATNTPREVYKVVSCLFPIARMLDLGQIFRNFTTWTTVTWVSTMLVARVFDFHKAYTMIIDKLDKEKWLMEQCLSDEFYHRLAYHSDLCEVTKLEELRVLCMQSRNSLVEN
tara:strand:+ start:457 stop:825 length:369 start_codon:yes stop_codon:yes gene_type:complete